MRRSGRDGARSAAFGAAWRGRRRDGACPRPRRELVHRRSGHSGRMSLWCAHASSLLAVARPSPHTRFEASMKWSQKVAVACVALVVPACAPNGVALGPRDSSLVDSSSTLCGESSSPGDRYRPQGPVVSAASECPVYPESCPYLCLAPVCAGVNGELSCEACADLDVYNSYDYPASGCRWFKVDGGAFSHACD